MFQPATPADAVVVALRMAPGVFHVFGREAGAYIGIGGLCVGAGESKRLDPSVANARLYGFRRTSKAPIGKLRGGGGCGDCHAVDVSYIQELVFDECAVAFSLACSGVAGDAGTDSPGIALCAQC